MADFFVRRRLIRISLTQLVSENMHHTFEHICRHVSHRRISTNILPPTGPVSAGGDQGRDFETFHTYMAEVDPTGRAPIPTGSPTTIAFACTTQRSRLKQKFQSDISKICGSGQAVERIYIFASTDVQLSLRHHIQVWASNNHGVAAEVIDGQALAEWLASDDLYPIAAKYLDLPAELPDPEDSFWRRYTKGTTQLGDDRPAVRIAGVGALARLADAWPSQRAHIAEILCTYLRIPMDMDPGSTQGAGEHQVRSAVVAEICRHLQDPLVESNWCSFTINLSGAVLQDAIFRGIKMKGGQLNLSGAHIVGHVSIESGRLEDSDILLGRLRIDDGATFTIRGCQLGTLGSGVFLMMDNTVVEKGELLISSCTFKDSTISVDHLTLDHGSFTLDCVDIDGSVVAFDSPRILSGDLIFWHTNLYSGEIRLRSLLLDKGSLILKETACRGGVMAIELCLLIGGDVTIVHLGAIGGMFVLSDVRVEGGTLTFEHVAALPGHILLSDLELASGRVQFLDGQGVQGSVHGILENPRSPIDWGGATTVPSPPWPEIQRRKLRFPTLKSLLPPLRGAEGREEH